MTSSSKAQQSGQGIQEMSKGITGLFFQATSCYNQFPQIQGGGPKEPDLAQLLGWALSHWVSDSLTDRFTGVLMMIF